MLSMVLPRRDLGPETGVPPEGTWDQRLGYPLPEGTWDQRLEYLLPEGTWDQRLEYPPPHVNGQTGVKTLPSNILRNAGGNNRKSKLLTDKMTGRNIRETVKD